MWQKLFWSPFWNKITCVCVCFFFFFVFFCFVFVLFLFFPQILFQKCKCIHVLLLWVKFYWKIPFGKCFFFFFFFFKFWLRDYFCENFLAAIWKQEHFWMFLYWFMVVLGVYRYGASFAPKFLRERLLSDTLLLSVRRSRIRNSI